jgi:hypothetical protein
MPAEYYVGAAIAGVMLFLLAQLFRPRPARRQNLRRGNGTDQLTIQLSRIADALEALVVHLGASLPRVEQPSVQKASERSGAKEVHSEASPPHVEQAPVPLQKAAEPSGTDTGKINQPAEHHVNLSMFGR